MMNQLFYHDFNRIFHIIFLVMQNDSSSEILDLIAIVATTSWEGEIIVNLVPYEGLTKMIHRPDFSPFQLSSADKLH